ncbi:DUF4383 domain-containing protein, partial [Streptomyces griseus]|nr:DUF4383 domain-containing protein [Streptomyces griseus]
PEQADRQAAAARRSAAAGGQLGRSGAQTLR